MSDLGSFQGKPIVASKVIVKKAGDGLTKPLAAEPRAFTSGEKAPMLLWGEWGSIRFDPTTEGHGFVQVHEFDTEETAVLDHVDIKMLEDLLVAQREKVRLWELEQQRLKDEAKGVTALPGTEAGGPVDGGPPIENGQPGGISEAEWADPARASSVSPIGSKRAKKGGA